MRLSKASSPELISSANLPAATVPNVDRYHIPHRYALDCISSAADKMGEGLVTLN